MTERGYTLIKCFEGLCLTAYKFGLFHSFPSSQKQNISIIFIIIFFFFAFLRDVGGIWTIGYGNTRYEDGSAVKSGDTITKARADSLFNYYVDQDFAPSVDELVGTPAIGDINQVQFEALVSFTYNVGSANFASSTLLKKVKANPNDPTIRDEFMKWVGTHSVNASVIQFNHFQIKL